MGESGGLRVTLLGTFEVRRGETVVPVVGARLRGLLTRLALAGGRPVDPGTLVDALWPEDRPAEPANALQSLVSRLRKILGGPGLVAQSEGGYRLAATDDDVDALRFERLAAAGRERLRAGDPETAAGVLGDAVMLWGEPAAIAAVAPAVATRLARESVEAVADLSGAELALGRAAEAEARLAPLLVANPLDERVAALLIDALTAQGREAEALARYEQTREAIADALGTDPGAALRERHLRLLHQTEIPEMSGWGVSRRSPGKVSAGPGAAGPGAAGPDAAGPDAAGPDAGGRVGGDAPTPSNLPASLTSFVGRDDDLARIETLLAGGRLITVLGPGGAGKTRLALEAGRRHRHEYRDGTWMIDLASVTEPAKVGAAFLAAIGLRGTAFFEGKVPVPGDEVEALAEQLGARQILLVVDNCEHLIDAVAHLIAALLPQCAGLRVLATSREPLAVDGEALVPLGPLTLPDPADDVETARRTASVRLFTDRAAAVRPGFDVNENNLPDISRVVRGLDGMPLALELAAARLRTMSLAELAAGLSDRFRLLTTGSRTALPRHRTLRAVIAWSWDLLSDDERTLADRVSVLPGGVTEASASAVCPAISGIADLLAALVDKSLLQLAPDPGRYRMLETLREYGIERLAEQGALEPAREHAARYLTEVVARHDPELRGPGQLVSLRAMHAEYDNILAALRHLCDSGDSAGAVTLALNLSWYWQMLGRHADASYWLGETLAVPAEPGLDRDCAQAILLLSEINDRSAMLSEAAQDSRSELRALADRLLTYPEVPGLAGALTAVTLFFVEETEQALTIMGRFTEGPDVWLAGLARMFRAQFAENAGDLETVRVEVPLALDCFRRAGDRWGQATALPMRALLRQYDGDLDGAQADLREARTLAREFGSLSLSDEVFIDLRWIDLSTRSGDADAAIAMIDDVRERVQRLGSADLVILIDALAAGLRLRLGDLDQARELVERAEAGMATDLTFAADHGHALVGAVRAALAIETGDGPAAEASLARAYAAGLKTKDMPILAVVAVTAATLAGFYERYHEAAVILGAAARLRGTHDRTDPETRRLVQRLVGSLGEEGFAEAYEIGWKLDGTTARKQVDPARLRREALPAGDQDRSIQARRA
ncbi:AfsR/SARP family transcriptional regulator [Paractinoplanes toevensis]|uniref:SARP family transcriptional regulator n=1 Tax=Paractinoplanes toevensis TaxID=571911 RepID=A0A919TB10_9ACTN|nr:BTAD domain-containing putative transcriptional regulator [Actinoplanes toevensis]GIM90944.1 SARP family transcriptional regulator [Actinoplanes toevensis]